MRSPGGDRCCRSLSALVLAAFTTVPVHETALRPSYPRCLAVSADGRFVAFVTTASLAPSDRNRDADIYVLDRVSGAVSLETAGVAGVAQHTPAISATGRFLVYEATVGGDALRVLMLRDRDTGAVRALQRGAAAPNASSRSPSISDDGGVVAFASSATNLVEGPDANGFAEDVYVADVRSMTFRRIGVGPSGVQSATVSTFAPAISADGRFVAFSAGPTYRASASSAERRIEVYHYDLGRGTATLVSFAPGGAADGSSYSASISGNGRFVAFVSEATNLAGRHDTNGTADVYVRDMVDGVTELVSRTPAGTSGNGISDHPVLSADGRIVVFQSEASDLTCGERCPAADRDINLVADIFRRDRGAATTEHVSRDETAWMEPSIGPAIDRTGNIVAFMSRHPIDQADDRHDYDLFVLGR